MDYHLTNKLAYCSERTSAIKCSGLCRNVMGYYRVKCIDILFHWDSEK